MPDRLVRFLPSFFDDVDRQLGSERGPTGTPSAVDFLLYDLPPIRDLLAVDFDRSTTSVANAGDLRVFLGIGTLVRGVAIYALVASDDQIDVVGLELDATPPDRDHDGEGTT